MRDTAGTGLPMWSCASPASLSAVLCLASLHAHMSCMALIPWCVFSVLLSGEMDINLINGAGMSPAAEQSWRVRHPYWAGTLHISPKVASLLWRADMLEEFLSSATSPASQACTDARHGMQLTPQVLVSQALPQGGVPNKGFHNVVPRLYLLQVHQRLLQPHLPSMPAPHCHVR